MRANKRKAQSKGAYENAAKVHKRKCRSKEDIKKEHGEGSSTGIMN